MENILNEYCMRVAERELLNQELEKRARQALEKLDPALRKCVVKDLLRRFLVTKAIKSLKNPDTAAKVFKAPGHRRVTRSMAARSSTIISSNAGIAATGKGSFLVPSTPKISPFLPETPAALRKQQQRTSTKAATKAGKEMDRRVMGSMISTSANAPDPILKMQLNDGTIVDVNLAADPSKVRMSLGEGMFTEVKRFLSNITKYAVKW